PKRQRGRPQELSLALRVGVEGASMAERPRIYGLLAEFDNPTALIQAVQAARREGYVRMDAYTPYPIEELTEALGFTKTRLPLLILIGGLVGCFGGYFMQYYSMSI